MKKILVAVPFILALILWSCNPNNDKAKSSSPYDIKVDSLMALMTLEEKIGQLNLPSAGDINTGLAQSTGIIAQIKDGQVGGLFNIRGVEKIRQTQQVAVDESRLGIPLLFAMDVIHGYKTVFPIPLGLSCTWDMDLIERTARIATQEATAEGIVWTFSPMVDIARDPRWGRIAEGSGEDAYLGSEVARAMVRGYQGDDLSANNTMMSCAKHFALYGAAEAGRDYNTVDMSRIRMYNDYLPPFKAAVEEGAGTLMASFNEIDGIPATGSRWLMTELLRDEWGFDGFVVADYTGVTEMIMHGMGDTATVAKLAISAGTDMDMVSEAYVNTLKQSVEDGSLSIEHIDRACRTILKAKYELGLFDDPYRYCDSSRSANEVFTSENRAEARSVAAQSFVLLKNENDILPLKKSGKIALIGPMADNVENMPGTWSVAGDFKTSVSVKMGIERLLGDQVEILHARGSNIYTDPDLEARVSTFGKPTRRDNRPEEVLIKEAVAVAMKADVILAAMGEASESAGESSSLTNIEMPDNQRRLLDALLKTGKPLVLVLFNGRPMALKWEQENVPAILDVWFGGTQAGEAIADVLFGDVNPSGKLTTTFPQNTGQIPLYYNHKMTGRPITDKWFQKFKTNYLDVSNEPVYPFGFGLSYATFDYGDIQLSSTDLSGGAELKVAVEITNSGDRDGKEVIQLYIRDMVGSITRPVKELRDFQKVEFKAGETKTVTFTITPDDLKFYNADLKHDWESGDFEIMVGGNSRDVKSAMVTWTK
ncbi:MAG: beta-glucosidase BglX [Cyclobacteriaceae bacterium]